MSTTVETTTVTIALAAAVLFALATLVAQVRLWQPIARSQHDEAVVAATRLVRMTPRLLLPLALVSVGAFIWLVREHDDLSLRADWWIGGVFGLAIVAAVTAFIFVVAEAALGARHAAATSSGDEETRWRLHRAVMFGRGLVLVLAVIAALVILRPT